MTSPFSLNTVRTTSSPITPHDLDQFFISKSGSVEKASELIIQDDTGGFKFRITPAGEFGRSTQTYRITTDGIDDGINDDVKEEFLKQILKKGQSVLLKSNDVDGGAKNFILPDYSEPSSTKIGGLYRFGSAEDPAAEKAAAKAAKAEKAAAAKAAKAAKAEKAAAAEADQGGGKSVQRRSRKRYSSSRRRRVSNKKYSASRRGRGRGRGRGRSQKN
jgi:hypothetical protein